VSIRRFRSRAEIKDAANAVSVLEGLESYRKATRIAEKSCSYSLETMRFYYGDVLEDRQDLLETYGDGRAVYILAPWTNDKSVLEDEDAHRICENIVSMGHIPFIGIWSFKDRIYEEPSFAINHGITETAVRNLLREFNQKAVCRVTAERARSIDRNDLSQVT